MLKGQDIVVLLALVGHEDRPRAALARALGWDDAGVHRSINRLSESTLFEAGRGRVSRARAEEFLIHGVPYVFPARLGPVTRGVPTAWAAPPLSSRFAPVDELPPVWPDPMGSVRGVAFEPLHRTAVHGAAADAVLHQRLALVDAIRGGDARSRALAAEMLPALLRP